MINLLNPNDLKQIRAARVNVRLRRYLVATFLMLLVVGGVYGVGYTLATNEYAKAKADNTNAQQSLAGYQDVKKRAEAYQSNLAVAKKILGNEVVFSTFMTDVAQTLPPNTILDSLTLSTKLAQGTPQKKAGTTQLKARAKSYNDILVLKTKLEESAIFSDVRIASTATPSVTKDLTGVEKNYPYLVTFDLVIDKMGGAK